MSEKRGRVIKSLKFDSFIKRILFGALFVFIFWSIAAIVHFVSFASIRIGFYFGFVVFALLLFYSLFEILQHLEASNLASLFLIINAGFWFIFPTGKHIIQLGYQDFPVFFFSLELLKYLGKSQIFDFDQEWFVSIFRLLVFTLSVVGVWKTSKLASNKRAFFYLFLIFFGIVNFWTFIFSLSAISFKLFALLSLAVMICDSCGYLFGKLLGRKIIPKNFANSISPNKTWEGTFGILLGGWIAFYFVFFWGEQNFLNSLPIAILAIVFLPAMAILGDLLFSVLKRKLTISEFSWLIPGHGGLNDRFDAATLVFLFLLLSLWFL